MDQLENGFAKITEQLQALTTAMENMNVPRAEGNSGNVRHEEPSVGLGDDIPAFDDDMTDYAARRTVGSQAEFRSSVTR